MVAKQGLLTETVDLIRQAHLACSQTLLVAKRGLLTGTVDVIRQAHLACSKHHGRQTESVDGDCLPYPSSTSDLFKKSWSPNGDC